MYKPSSHSPSPASQIILLVEKVDALERWKASTENDLKEIREIISQVKLLMSLSIGGGGLSIISLIVTIAALVARLK
jgi:hypothetical protein